MTRARWSFAGRTFSTAAYCALLVGMAAFAERQVPGDGPEYLSLARVLYAHADPGVPRHFWGYSALTVPLLHVLVPLRVDPLYAFVALNVALLTAAWWAATHLPFALRLAVFVSPIVWWSDKAHTEVLTFSALAVAWVTWRDRPWWALTACGLAAMQNPPVAAALALFAAMSLIVEPTRLRSGRWWLGLVVASSIALLHPLYYWHAAGQWSRLGDPANRAAGLSWWWVVLVEPNLGVLPNAPLLSALIVACGTAALVRFVRRRDVLADVPMAAGLTAVFLVAFTRIGNINHGATPGPSRYALWLIPMAMPVLAAGWAALPRARPWLTTVAIVSAAASLWAFSPGRPENHLRPTALATWLWREAPEYVVPPPEVFSERINGSEDGTLPVATAGCEKILLTGRGSGKAVSPWPAACWPVEVPAHCHEAGALCYADRHGDGYTFRFLGGTRVGFRFAPEHAWMRLGEQRARARVEALGWGVLSPVRGGESREWLRGAFGVGEVHQFVAPRGCVLLLKNVVVPASVALRFPAPARIEIFDEATGEPIDTGARTVARGELVQIDAGPSTGAVVVVEFLGL